ncbi:MAG: hypothetical protein DRK00_07270 [Thermoprotei archaeon]|nr:MAG: hypothetical protein DRK00_07270 [Thermoprotei archaeon]
MRIEVEERALELDWADMAILLTLLWAEADALIPSDLTPIIPDYSRLTKKLKRLEELELVEILEIGAERRLRFIYLTELGLKAARKVEELARKHGLL